MNNEDLNKIVENRLQSVKDILVRKGLEYAPVDRLINFKKGGTKTDRDPLYVLRGYMLKHEVSFDDICDTFIESGQVDNDLLDEKLTDILAYYLLAECIMKEEQVNIKNQIEKLKEVHI